MLRLCACVSAQMHYVEVENPLIAKRYLLFTGKSFHKQVSHCVCYPSPCSSITLKPTLNLHIAPEGFIAHRVESDPYLRGRGTETRGDELRSCCFFTEGMRRGEGKRVVVVTGSDSRPPRGVVSDAPRSRLSGPSRLYYRRWTL